MGEVLTHLPACVQPFNLEATTLQCVEMVFNGAGYLVTRHPFSQ